ncbi:MAG: NnrS family protein [Rubrivivax sp.]|nr:NnrS family protein [Rubrivivax sp.]
MKPSVLPIAPSAPSPIAQAPRGWPLLRLGFRPFYLGATVFAALAVPFWLVLYLGQASLESKVSPLLWHAHEMLFGFAVAVIVGFLLTAGKAWTGLATPRGPVLGLLAGLWLAARLAALVAPYGWYALLDLLLLPLVAGVLIDVLWRAGNRRNLPLVGLLLGLALVNLLFHLAMLGTITLSPLRPLYGALALIVMIESVMAGRVIPAFTNSATPGLNLVPSPRQSQITLALTAAGLLAWVLAAPAWLAGGALAAAGAAQLQRQWAWRPWVTRGRPILWILHAAYAWIAVGLILLALAQWGWVSASAGIHALGVGATGGLIIGMVTRTARGHTGRPLQASGAEVAAYALVLGAALMRVVMPLLAPQWLVGWLIAAALAWSVAFVIYLVIYTPWLMSTRLDGKDG